MRISPTCRRCTASLGAIDRDIVAIWARPTTASRAGHELDRVALIARRAHAASRARRSRCCRRGPSRRRAAKGFPYHFHPLTAGLYPQWLVFVVWLWERAPRARKVAVAVAIPRPRGSRFASRRDVRFAAHQRALARRQGRDQRRARGEGLPRLFRATTFSRGRCAKPPRTCASTRSRPIACRIYGMDPYVLFLAERMSATPYIYAYDLNADAALAGRARAGFTQRRRKRRGSARFATSTRTIWSRAPKRATGGLRVLRQIAAHHVARRVARFQSTRSAAAWVAEHYKQTAAFGDDRVWLRRDWPKQFRCAMPSHTKVT